MQDYQSTPIGQKFADDEVEHAGESGFAIVRYGRNAFSIHIAMTDVAEKTLDLVWITEDEGVEVRYDKVPLSTFGQRFMSGFIGILLVESQL